MYISISMYLNVTYLKYAANEFFLLTFIMYLNSFECPSKENINITCFIFNTEHTIANLNCMAIWISLCELQCGRQKARQTKFINIFSTLLKNVMNHFSDSLTVHYNCHLLYFIWLIYEIMLHLKIFYLVSVYNFMYPFLLQFLLFSSTILEENQPCLKM